jgi:hypothetical protein
MPVIHDFEDEQEDGPDGWVAGVAALQVQRDILACD